jgi:hypothetical protein
MAFRSDQANKSTIQTSITVIKFESHQFIVLVAWVLGNFFFQNPELKKSRTKKIMTTIVPNDPPVHIGNAAPKSYPHWRVGRSDIKCRLS